MRRFVFAPRSLATVAIAAGLCSLAFLLASPAFAEDPAPDDDAGAVEDSQPETPAAPDAAKPDVPVRRTGEVSITAARSERPVLDVAGNVTVIDRARIDQSGARDVPELLRREAGLYVTNSSTNPEGYTVEARGFNNGGGNGSNLLVLMDGRRINEADSSFIDWSMVHLDRVEKIEVVRGPASALYGDNASGGVIEITTKDGKGAPQLVLTSRGGSFDSAGGSLFAGGSHDIWTGAFYVEGSTTAGYRDQSDYDVHTFNGRARVTPTEDASFEVQSGYSSDHRERPGTLTLDEMRDLGRSAAEPDLRRFDDARERFVQGRGDVLLADGVTLTLAPYWRSRSDDGAFDDRGVFPSTFDFGIDSYSLGGSTQVEVALPVGPFANRGIAGFEFLRETTHRTAFSTSSFGDFTGTTDLKRRIWSLFVQDELSLTERIILSAGLRYDDPHYAGDSVGESDFGVDESELGLSRRIWSPRAALTWRFVDSTSAYASYNRGLRLPDFDEALGFTGDLYDLVPQRSNAYEVGLKHRSHGVSANLAFYWMKVEDEIFFDPYVRVDDPVFGPLSLPQNVNLDRVRHRGIEASGSWQALEWLELYASYTFDDSEIVEDSVSQLDGQRMPITPKNRGTAGMVVTMPYGFRSALNANVVGKRSVANDLVGSADELGSYYTIDTTLEWHHGFGDLFDLLVLFRVRNLTDQDYEEFAGAPSFGAGPTGFYPAPGRYYEAGFTLTWKP